MIIVLKNDIYTQLKLAPTIPLREWLSHEVISSVRIFYQRIDKATSMTEINVQCTVLARAISFKGYKEFRQ